jgi:hypothetical protein
MTYFDQNESATQRKKQKEETRGDIRGGNKRWAQGRKTDEPREGN